MDILLTGSVAYDYLMKFPGYFRDHILPDHLESISLSFLVESMIRRRGGNAPNIAYTLALLGERPRIMATVGEDCEDYKSWLSGLGVDISLMQVIRGEFTASFFANTDQANAQIASFYPGAMGYAAQLTFHELEGDLPDLVVISPNDPRAMDRYVRECQELNIPYLYDPSQQIVRLDAEELKLGIVGAQAMFLNDYEYNLVKKITGLDKTAIMDHVKFLVITCGENGSTIYNGSQQYDIPVFHPKMILDPTGVGDAYRGGFLAAFGRGMDWEMCGRVGALAATYCLEQEGPQGHLFTLAEFIARFRRQFDDQGLLDQLLVEPQDPA
jgi:adenosine kinase